MTTIDRPDGPDRPSRRRRARRIGAGRRDRARRADRRIATTVRRALAVVLAVGTVAAGMLADRHAVVDAPVAFGERVDLPMPALRPAASLGASWFCPGVPAVDAAAGGVVVLANPTDNPVATSVTVTASDAAVAPVARDVTVPERGHIELAVTEFVTAPFAAVQVEARSGALVVEQRAAGKLDAQAATVYSVSPCATAPSENWYFADGSTTTEADETLLVYNPFPDDAVVDLVFSDDAGVRRPPTLQSRPIPARSLVAVNVGATIQRKELVSVGLHAKVGRVVLGRYQVYSSKPRRTLVAGLATPSAGQSWTFADGERVAGDAPGSASTTFAVYNPGADDAQVTVTVLPESGSAIAGLTAPVAADPSAAAVDPAAAATDPNAAPVVPDTAAVAPDPNTVTVTVAAGTSVLVPLDKVPNGRFSSLVTSSAPIVVERQLVRVGDPRVVTTVQFGSRLSSTRWAFATAAVGSWTGTLIVANPAPQAGTVSVQVLSAAGLAPVAGMTDLPVPATGSIRIDLGPAGVGSAAIVVDATTDVVVERLLAPPADQPGSASSLGMPVVAA